MRGQRTGLRRDTRARAAARLPASVVATLDAAKILGLKAGVGSHRFIGVWVVVVDGRVFVRSYTVSTDGWFAAFRRDSRGVIQAGNRIVRVRARIVRSAKIRDAVDRAYALKYNTPGSRKYVRGFRLPRRKATTTEFVPREPRR